MLLTVLANLLGCTTRKDTKESWPYALHVDGLDFSVTNHPSVLARIDSIKISELAFTNANINDVIERLLVLSKESEKKDGRAGISIVINRGATAASEDGALPTGPSAELPLITMRERNISMLEAIKRTAKIEGLQWYLQGDGFLEFKPTIGQPLVGGDGVNPPPQR
jgi:hypothetical protein